MATRISNNIIFRNLFRVPDRRFFLTRRTMSTPINRQVAREFYDVRRCRGCDRYTSDISGLCQACLLGGRGCPW